MLSSASRSLTWMAGLALASVLIGCGSSGHSPTTQPAESTSKTDSAKVAAPAQTTLWRSLFDGETLKNWKATDFGGQGEVRVENGQIILPMGAALTGINWDDGRLPSVNYEIELDAQRVEGSDFFCGLTVPARDSHVTLILGGWGGSVTGISSLDGYDASDNETSTVRQYKNKQWYHVRMRILQNRIQAWVDDDQVVDVDTSNKKLGIRMEVEPSKPLGVASWQTTAAIKNIRLRQLAPSEIPQQQPEEK